MRKLLTILEETLERGENVVLVSIIDSDGSAPRGAGARMLVGANGRLAGTVGGGAVEYRCITTAQELLGGETVLKDYCLNQGDQTGLGMICGGDVQVHFLPIAAHDPGVLALCREAADYFRDGTPFWLVTPLQPGEQPVLWTGTGDARTLPFTPAQALSPDPKIYEADGKCWFTEELQSPGRVYIFGGGHVAQALVPILASVDFSCVVLENREEFSDPSLFPQASRVCKIDFSRLDREVHITEEDYVCVVTRGHKDDLLVTEQALRTPAYYIGLIGSRKKSAVAFERLREMGYTKEDLDRVITPIGLPIGGRTPAEIAISITAQLIQYRTARYPKG